MIFLLVDSWPNFCWSERADCVSVSFCASLTARRSASRLAEGLRWSWRGGFLALSFLCDFNGPWRETILSSRRGREGRKGGGAGAQWQGQPSLRVRRSWPEIFE